jgi:hypothetical protein
MCSAMYAFVTLNCLLYTLFTSPRITLFTPHTTLHRTFSHPSISLPYTKLGKIKNALLEGGYIKCDSADAYIDSVTDKAWKRLGDSYSSTLCMQHRCVCVNVYMCIYVSISIYVYIRCAWRKDSCVYVNVYVCVHLLICIPTLCICNTVV